MDIAEAIANERRWVFLQARRLLNEDDAEDATQMTMCKAIQNASCFRGESQLRTWLYSILHNGIFNERRSWQRNGFLSSDEPGYDEMAYQIEDPSNFVDDLINRDEANRILSQCKVHMSSVDRDVIWARDVNDMSYRQAANMLGVTEKAFKARLFRARCRLRETVLAAYGA